MSAERTEFWLVWRERGGSPTHQHWTKDEAIHEAERLARLQPGDVFYIMKSTAALVAPAVEIERVKLIPGDGIPF